MIKDKECILFFAFRYSLKRQTYAPSVVCEELLNCWQDLSHNAKLSIYKEIKDDYDDLDYINKKIWDQIIEKYESEIK